MRRLILMRHAKSSWSDEHPDDFDRPLNKRGYRDAPLMGGLLASQVLTPDRIVTSSARRAAETAACVASASGFQGELLVTRELYLAPPESYFEVAARQRDEWQRLLLIGHNPGITDLVRELSGEPRHMSTATLAQFELEIESWSELRRATRCRLRSFWRPADLEHLP